MLPDALLDAGLSANIWPPSRFFVDALVKSDFGLLLRFIKSAMFLRFAMARGSQIGVLDILHAHLFVPVRTQLGRAWRHDVIRRRDVLLAAATSSQPSLSLKSSWLDKPGIIELVLKHLSVILHALDVALDLGLACTTDDALMLGRRGIHVLVVQHCRRHGCLCT